MQSLHVNGYDMPYLDVGEDRGRPPLVCVHGSLNDFRVWSCVLGPLTQRHRVIAVSLRHFFPERWDGLSDTYSIAQHVQDVIAFIEKLDLGPVDLMGHSRGGHICFRVAQARPDLLRRLVLAEPGGELDASLDPDYVGGPSPLLARFTASAEKIRDGDVDGGLAVFVDTLEGSRHLAAAAGDGEAEPSRQRHDADRPGPRQPPTVLEGGCGIDQNADALHFGRADQGPAAEGAARTRRACALLEDGDHPERDASDVRAGAAKILRSGSGLSGELIMQSFQVNGYDMAYLEVGEGHPLVCVHGTLGDFRTWYSVLGPLSKNHRVISVSLRHFFPSIGTPSATITRWPSMSRTRSPSSSR